MTLLEGLQAPGRMEIRRSEELSDVCAKLGELEPVLVWRKQWFLESLCVIDLALLQFPRERELLEDRGWCLERLADVAWRMDEQAEALGLALERCCDADALAEMWPGDPKVLANLVSAESQVSFFTGALGDLSAKRCFCERARSHADVLVALDGQNADYRRKRAMVCLFLAGQSWGNGYTSAALEDVHTCYSDASKVYWSNQGMQEFLYLMLFSASMLCEIDVREGRRVILDIKGELRLPQSVGASEHQVAFVATFTSWLELQVDCNAGELTTEEYLDEIVSLQASMLELLASPQASTEDIALVVKQMRDFDGDRLIAAYRDLKDLAPEKAALMLHGLLDTLRHKTPIRSGNLDLIDHLEKLERAEGLG